MIKSILLVTIGGGIGSALRYLVNTIVSKNIPNKAFLATFLVNIIGCFIIGFLIGYLTKNNNNEYLKLLLITGFCGGFTTFSAFGLENYNFLQSGTIFNALLYIAISIIIGILFVGLGIYLSK